MTQRACGSRRGIAALRQWAHHGWPLRAIARGAAVRRVRGSRFRSVMRWSLVRPMGMGADTRKHRCFRLAYQDLTSLLPSSEMTSFETNRKEAARAGADAMHLVGQDLG